MEFLAKALLPAIVGIVVIILIIGMWNMLRGGSSSRSQNLMRARVIAQFAAIVVAMTVLWITQR